MTADLAALVKAYDEDKAAGGLCHNGGGQWVYVVSPDEWTFAHHIPDAGGGEGWRR
jgi:hypothetical protein